LTVLAVNHHLILLSATLATIHSARDRAAAMRNVSVLLDVCDVEKRTVSPTAHAFDAVRAQQHGITSVMRDMHHSLPPRSTLRFGLRDVRVPILRHSFSTLS
jgi:hypothetical protein